MKYTLKKYFVPHHGNNFHPHILHTRRAILYSGLFVAIKVIVVVLALAIPLPAFVTPDVLLAQQTRIMALVNELRTSSGRPPLREVSALNRSAGLKASDMSMLSYFSHIGPNNHNLKFFLSSVKYSYRTAGENLAMGFSDAEALVNAWVQSPTHYQNIIDVDYVENGIGMSGGLYQDLPTVYTAMHFGAPKVVVSARATTTSAPVATVPALANKAVKKPIEPSFVTSSLVLGEQISTPLSIYPVVSYNQATSFVSWQPVGTGTRVVAIVFISGSVKDAFVQVKDQKIPLLATNDTVDGYTRYVGEAVLTITHQQLFSVVISPSVVITNESGQHIFDTIRWDRVEIVSPDPIQKYLLTQKTTPYLTMVNSFSRNLYIGFFLFFALSLIIMIGIEIKCQQHHIILQTLGLLGLLAVLVIS